MSELETSEHIHKQLLIYVILTVLDNNIHTQMNNKGVPAVVNRSDDQSSMK
ncbi:hypothetical protein [Staphylococcus caeli]|uniref:hypothetical protein n=1 Tax=Staphylococcus caeli TaxID=2201815 RepID=UPI0013565039|nr:hypothetical protein [Staphylococcus caeli]